MTDRKTVEDAIAKIHEQMKEADGHENGGQALLMAHLAMNEILIDCLLGLQEEISDLRYGNSGLQQFMNDMQNLSGSLDSLRTQIRDKRFVE